MAWNEYVDAFTFISTQFWVSQEMNKLEVQRLFEAMQMVPSTRTTFTSHVGTPRNVWG